MGYAFNPFSGTFDNTGSDKFKDLDANKLEPTDSARKQIHLGGENTLVDTISPGSTVVSLIGDGVQSAFFSETYSSGPTTAAGLVGVRGRGSKSSPAGVQNGDILFTLGATGITANGTNGFFVGQFGGFVLAAAADATNSTVPMSMAISINEGDVIKAYPGRNVFIGSGSVTPTEKLGLRGRIELEQATAPTANTNFGKVWYSSVDKKLYFMDDVGTSYDLTSGGSSTNGYVYQDYEKTGTYTYVGYEHADGRWYIYRRTLADNTRLYASGASGYNWSNRASETYS